MWHNLRARTSPMAAFVTAAAVRLRGRVRTPATHIARRHICATWSLRDVEHDHAQRASRPRRAQRPRDDARRYEAQREMRRPGRAPPSEQETSLVRQVRDSGDDVLYGVNPVLNAVRHRAQARQRRSAASHPRRRLRIRRRRNRSGQGRAQRAGGASQASGRRRTSLRAGIPARARAARERRRASGAGRRVRPAQRRRRAADSALPGRDGRRGVGAELRAVGGRHQQGVCRRGGGGSGVCDAVAAASAAQAARGGMARRGAGRGRRQNAARGGADSAHRAGGGRRGRRAARAGEEGVRRRGGHRRRLRRGGLAQRQRGRRHRAASPAAALGSRAATRAHVASGACVTRRVHCAGVVQALYYRAASSCVCEAREWRSVAPPPRYPYLACPMRQRPRVILHYAHLLAPPVVMPPVNPSPPKDAPPRPVSVLDENGFKCLPDSDVVVAPPLPAAYTLDRHSLMPPDLLESQGLPSSAAVIEVPNGSCSLYVSILRYAAEFAVDLSQDISPQDDFPHVSVSESSRVEKLCDNVPVPLRDGQGRLSNLWNCPDDRYTPADLSDSDSDSDSDAGSDTTDYSNDGSDELHHLSSRSLNRKQEPPVRRYQLGLGYAKLYVRDKLVIVRHWAYGMPLTDSFSTILYRAVVVAAEDPKTLKEFCAVALKWRTDRDQANDHAKPGKFTLFRFRTSGRGSGDWANQGFKKARPAKSVVLQQGQMDSIITDIKDFLSRDTRAWYQAHGLPHRRSYLFYGPPGVGKTSTIRVVAGMFRLNACFLSLTAADFSNQVLHDALTSLPRCALLVLEDVDVLFNEDRKSESTALTFSGMLNALDGLISVDGIITIFTTNHIEKLDPALIRAGRVDRRFEFVHPRMDQMCSLFKSFYESASDETAKKFAKTVFDRPEEEAQSIATLQQHFIYTRKKSAEECVELIPQFFKEFYPKGAHGKTSIYS
ncbi:Mitochondrial chaperone BCS1 [Gracilaria domingensis]|nr:Mitochondrial chaperone BCS1 [Gracilaria domingensis]